MTAPTSMPVLPAVTRSSAPPSSSSSSADNAPAFASALDDALTGGGKAAGTPADTGPGGEAEQADATASPETPAPLPVVLVPGLWALMTAVTPLTAAAGGIAAATAAASLIGAVTGNPVPTAATAPAQPALPALPAAADAAQAAVAAGQATTPALALAEAAGLTLVLDAAPATGTPGAPAAPAPGAEATVTAPLLPTATPADGGTDAGTDSGTGGPVPAAPATEEAPVADTDSVAVVGGTTQATASAPAAEVAQPPAGLDDAPVATQLGRQIAVLRNAPDGSQTMTVVITPETLGPVTIAVTVTAGTLDLTLQGSSDHGRHALLEALPDLRRDLEGAGLAFSKLEVGSNTDPGTGARPGQQQLLDARAGQQGSQGQPGQQQPRTWGSVPDLAADGTPLTTDLSSPAGVDVRV